MGDDTTNEDFPDQEQRAAVCYRQWRENKAADSTATDEVQTDSTDEMEKAVADNSLKAISRTDDELRAANYIVLFGGRDLEGVGSPRVNADGTKGEYFTTQTDLESFYTKAGMVAIDWEHGQGELGDEILGVVDWKTARVDDRGVFVERVLNRRNQYVHWLEELGWFDDGMLGTSSHADPTDVEKATDGAILRWPLMRDTITVQPMEPRMLAENQLRAYKALGLTVPDDTEAEPEQEPETAPEDAQASVAVAMVKARCQQILLELMEETS